MKSTTMKIGAILAYLCLATAAPASLIFSTYDGVNIGSPVAVEWFGTGGSRWAVTAGFTGGNDYSLDHVTLNVQMLSGDSTNIHVYLSGDPPGAPYVAELFAATAIGAQGNYDFFPSSPLVLAANSYYAIALEPAMISGTQLYWYRAPPDVSDSTYSDNTEGTGNWTGWGISQATTPSIRVFADVVPEPSTCLLLGIGTLAIVARRFISQCRP
jgi:hypothetical protein